MFPQSSNYRLSVFFVRRAATIAPVLHSPDEHIFYPKLDSRPEAVNIMLYAAWGLT